VTIRALRSFALTCLANHRLLPPLTLAIVEPRFGAAPHVFANEIGEEDVPAGEGRRSRVVEPGET